MSPQETKPLQPNPQIAPAETTTGASPPKILWVGDAACQSGFARCTHTACDELSRAGWEVHILGINYSGDPHDHPYKIYPPLQAFEGRDPHGVTRLPHLIRRINPDVVVILNDAWNIPGYLACLEKELPIATGRPPIVGWVAVDAKNQPGRPLNALNHVIVWTEFAAEELEAGGYKGASTVVPLGVDLEIYSPRDRAASRRQVLSRDVPEDAFIVGVVGRNQPRKRLDLSIAYFAEWIKGHQVDDAYLYLHVAPTGDKGTDIPRLVHYYGISGKVILASPTTPKGTSESLMPSVYSAFDVYLSTSQGEGWGLPCLEAMACGVPCVVPDYSGLGSWVGDAAVKVPCTSTALSAPQNSMMYTVGGVVDRHDTIGILDQMYSRPEIRKTYRERGLALARTLTWERTGREFRLALESVLGHTAKSAERGPLEVAV